MKEKSSLADITTCEFGGIKGFDLVQNLCKVPFCALIPLPIREVEEKKRKEPLEQALYSNFKKEKRAFYMEKSMDEDAVLFMVVMVSKAGDEEEKENMSTKKMGTNGLYV
ncbi:hypothetical protein Tco_0962524 [Tanacetum coccineum]